MTDDLEIQGHMILHVTLGLPLSASTHPLAKNFFFVFNVSWVRESIPATAKCVTITRMTSKFKGHMILQGVSPISATILLLLSSLPSAVPTMRLSQDFSRLPFCLFLVALPVLVVFGYFSPSGPS